MSKSGDGQEFDCSQTPKGDAKRIEALRAKQSDPAYRFDIFLSHSHVDETACLALYDKLVELGREVRGRPFEVYLDKIVDILPPGDEVTGQNAHRLQRRITQSDFLVFAFSNSARTSKWMPWELGFFDALIGQKRICVHPLSAKDEIDFSSFEYLQLYRLVDCGELVDFFREAYQRERRGEHRYAAGKVSNEQQMDLSEFGPTAAGLIDWEALSRAQEDAIQAIVANRPEATTTHASSGLNNGLDDGRLGKVPGLDAHLKMTADDVKKRWREDPLNAPFAVWLKGAEFWEDWLGQMLGTPSRGRPAGLGADRLGKAEGLDRHLQMTADDFKKRLRVDPINAPLAVYLRAAEFWRDWLKAMLPPGGVGDDPDRGGQ